MKKNTLLIDIKSWTQLWFPGDPQTLADLGSKLSWLQTVPELSIIGYSALLSSSEVPVLENIWCTERELGHSLPFTAQREQSLQCFSLVQFSGWNTLSLQEGAELLLPVLRAKQVLTGTQSHPSGANTQAFSLCLAE